MLLQALKSIPAYPDYVVVKVLVAVAVTVVVLDWVAVVVVENLRDAHAIFCPPHFYAETTNLGFE